jgi:hypothetical protein
MSCWKIKDAYVYLTSTDLRWVHEGEHGITRELLAMVSENRMILDAFILFEGETLVRKQYVLEDRINVNLWLTDDYEIESAFAVIMDKGVRQS